MYVYCLYFVYVFWMYIVCILYMYFGCILSVFCICIASVSCIYIEWFLVWKHAVKWNENVKIHPSCGVYLPTLAWTTFALVMWVVLYAYKCENMQWSDTRVTVHPLCIIYWTSLAWTTFGLVLWVCCKYITCCMHIVCILYVYCMLTSVNSSLLRRRTGTCLPLLKP